MFWHFGAAFHPCWARRWTLLELCCCLTWRALPVPAPPPWQVKLSIQRGCTTRAWTPSTAFPWLLSWTSSSCVFMVVCLQKSRILTTSGKYVIPVFSLISLLSVLNSRHSFKIRPVSPRLRLVCSSAWLKTLDSRLGSWWIVWLQSEGRSNRVIRQRLLETFLPSCYSNINLWCIVY